MESKNPKKPKYKGPILCPVYGKVFGEREEVNGKVTIKKHCPRCEKIRYITKKG